MQIFEASLQFTLMRVGDSDPLTRPWHYAEYMWDAVEQYPTTESMWVISMNPKGRPIARTLLRTGPLAAGMTSARDIARVVILADANALVVVRGEPGENYRMTVHDRMAAQRYQDMAKILGWEFRDYLVLPVNRNPNGHFDTWRQGATCKP